MPKPLLMPFFHEPYFWLVPPSFYFHYFPIKDTVFLLYHWIGTYYAFMPLINMKCTTQDCQYLPKNLGNAPQEVAFSLKSHLQEKHTQKQNKKKKKNQNSRNKHKRGKRKRTRSIHVIYNHPQITKRLPTVMFQL